MLRDEEKRRALLNVQKDIQYNSHGNKTFKPNKLKMQF
jgi:hypothetical protein